MRGGRGGAGHGVLDVLEGDRDALRAGGSPGRDARDVAAADGGGGDPRGSNAAPRGVGPARYWLPATSSTSTRNFIPWY
jgi:hypothetical protein